MRKIILPNKLDVTKEIKLREKYCPNCGSDDISIFYRIEKVPVHSVLLFRSREDAINYPKGDIALGFCYNCNFISNFAFDKKMHEYSAECEESQGFSDTFNKFQHNLARQLVDRYDLYNKNIIEIGCGKGEFINLLCELGDNKGLGFDPAFRGDRVSENSNDNLTFIKDFYSEKYTHYQADFVCCKMTLEHIHKTADFVNMIRRSIGDRFQTIVFFQVPDVNRIFSEVAFWDIYYEHCSYFNSCSLSYLFRNCGFDILNLWKDYGDQYLMIEARPRKNRFFQSSSEKEETEEIIKGLSHFIKEYNNRLEIWKDFLQNISDSNEKVVLWGSGSKAVSFLTTLKIYNQISFVVDINTYRQETFTAGTGQKIISPDYLCEYQPDIVIVMNPIYHDEIKQLLSSMYLNPKMININCALHQECQRIT